MFKFCGSGGDAGDGKTNDLVLSCPFFRNEIGGEEERRIALNRTTAQKRVQNLLGNISTSDTSELTRRPVGYVQDTHYSSIIFCMGFALCRSHR